MEFVQRNCSVYDCLLEKVNPTVIQSLSETKITGEWLKSEINKCKFDLVKVGIKVITNNHLFKCKYILKVAQYLGGD